MRQDSFLQTLTRGTQVQSRLRQRTLMAALTCLTPAVALSAVGNDAHGTLLDATWGVLLGILIAIAVVVYWPLKTFLQQRGKGKLNEDVPAESDRKTDNS